jgi:DNA/RNA endonuclease YhcR with UshA esterase domain
MTRSSRCSSLLFSASLLLLSAITGSIAIAALADHVIPIAEARKLALGTSVTIDGSVSTPSGAFESSFSDKGFGLQDRSAGIYISTPTNLKIAPPKRVRVSGVLKDQSGLLVVVPTDATAVKVGGDGPRIEPKLVKTAMVGEATEGWIVRVVGKITQAPVSDGAYGFKFSVNDGSGEALIFVNVQTGIAMSSLNVGQAVRVTGFSSQYDTHYEIDPRSPADITAAKP